MMKELLCMKIALREINGYNDLSYWNRNSQLHTSLCLDDSRKILKKQIVVGLGSEERFQAFNSSRIIIIFAGVLCQNSAGRRRKQQSSHC